jgi:hypothetical protein
MSAAGIEVSPWIRKLFEDVIKYRVTTIQLTPPSYLELLR